MTPARLTLGQIADDLGLCLEGDKTIEIHGIAAIQEARSGQLTFLANPKYHRFLATTEAACVILSQDMAGDCPVAALISATPYADYARAATRFDLSRHFNPGIHPSAVVSASAQIGTGVCIGPTAVIESGAKIADDVYIGPGTVVGDHVEIGNNCFLAARVTLYSKVKLGQRVTIHSGAVVGADGFGYAMDHGQWLKVPQLGSVVVGDDCEIGANTTIDRGANTDTVLEQDVRLDNQIQIAHNVIIGAHTAIAGCAAVAGSTRIGSYCLIGGGAGILGHLEITDRVTVTAMSLVTHSIRQAGDYSSGTPLQPNRDWRRNAVRLKHLDEMARHLNRLRKEVKK